MSVRFNTDDFVVGESAYNVGQDSKVCPQVGCTVFQFKKTMRCVIDKLGGAVGTYYGDAMDVFDKNPAKHDSVDAICFSGGSLNGLIAVAGVAEQMVKDAIQYNKRESDAEDAFYFIPVVRGAITFSGAWGKVNTWKPPDAALGSLALQNLCQTIHLGQHGAGSNAEVGSILTNFYGAPGGQGAYNETRSFGSCNVFCAAYCNLNSKGAIYKEDKLFYGPGVPNQNSNNGRSTNILIHTNAKLRSIDLMRQLARQVHVSIASIIRPYAAHSDGDVLFLTSSEAVEVEDCIALGVFFSECLKKAVYSVVEHHHKVNQTQVVCSPVIF